MLHRTHWLIPLALLVFACDGESDPVPAPPNPLAQVEGFCKDWARGACNETVVSDCSGGGSDTEACITSQAAACVVLMRGKEYSADHADACLDAVEAAYADARINREELTLITELGAPCDLVTSGDGVDGDSCSTDTNCDLAGGYQCLGGTCGIPAVVGGGRACGQPQQICEDQFYCNGSNCIEKGGQGATCSDTAPCLIGLSCEGTPGAQTCVTKLDNGASCQNHDDCASGICDRPSGQPMGSV